MVPEIRAFKPSLAIAALAGCVVLGAFSHHQRGTASGPAARGDIQDHAIASFADWPEMPRSLALLMLERHGAPDRADANTLTWRKRTPWERIIVLKDQPHSPLRQVVNYYVPRNKLSQVLSLQNGIGVDSWNSELSAQNEMESMNFLVLNLADEIARDVRTTEEALEFLRTTSRLAAAGKSSRYMEELLFEPHRNEMPRWESPAAFP